MDGGRSSNYGRGGGGRGYHRAQGSGGRGSHHHPRPQRQWVDRAQVPGEQPPQQGAGGGSAWTGRLGGQSPAPSLFPAQSPTRPPPSRSSPDELDIQSLKISPQQALSPPSPPSEGEESQIQPIRRPDKGGENSVRRLRLLVNHFPVKFDPSKTIFHYDVDVKPVTNDNRPMKKTVRKSDLPLIRDKLSSDNPDAFPISKTTYDGEKNIFSAVVLPSGQYKVELPGVFFKNNTK